MSESNSCKEWATASQHIAHCKPLSSLVHAAQSSIIVHIRMSISASIDAAQQACNKLMCAHRKSRWAIVETLLAYFGKVSISANQDLSSHRRLILVKVHCHAAFISIIVSDLQQIGYVDAGSATLVCQP